MLIHHLCTIIFGSIKFEFELHVPGTGMGQSLKSLKGQVTY